MKGGGLVHALKMCLANPSFYQYEEEIIQLHSNGNASKIRLSKEVIFLLNVPLDKRIFHAMHFKCLITGCFLWWLTQMLWLIFKDVIKFLSYCLVTETFNLAFFIPVSFSYKIRCHSVKMQGQCIRNVRAAIWLNLFLHVSKREYGQEKRIISKLIMYRRISMHSCFIGDITDIWYTIGIILQVYCRSI